MRLGAFTKKIRMRLNASRFWRSPRKFSLENNPKGPFVILLLAGNPPKPSRSNENGVQWLSECGGKRMAAKPTSRDLGSPGTQYDAEKADYLHGRLTLRGLYQDFRGVKVQGCEACVFGERYQHTCIAGQVERMYGTAADEQLRLTVGRARRFSLNR